MKHSPQHRTLVAAALATATLATAGLLHASAFAEGRDSSQIRRGALLVGIGGCMDCHTPLKMGANGPEKDVARGLSGHPEELKLPTPPQLNAAWNWTGSASLTAFTGPWGTTYASNLTPDRETGIGNWKEKDFIQAMRTGKHLGAGRPIMPPMPWQSLAGLPTAELRAVYAYLMSRPAVKNRVPEYVPPAAVAAK